MEAWYAAQSPTVRRYLLALTADPQLADDLTQETFVQALVSVHGYRGGSVRAYLVGIARRVYARTVERERREREARARSGAPPPVAEAEAFSEGEAVLPDLPADDRYLLVGRGIWRRPFAEIAQDLGRTENWARVRYFRLISRLREDLGEAGERDV